MTPISIVQLLLNASWVVQAVVALLVVVSIVSWAAIFRKVFALQRVRAKNEDFEREFWSGANLNDLYAAAAQSARQSGPMERIFASGMREYQKLRERRITDSGALLDARAATCGRASASSTLSQPLVLALVCSVWPYVARSARWASCTPSPACRAGPGRWPRCTGIAEALVATAIGLFAAIPAVVAYNRFAHDIDRVANRMETFMEEFSNILQRNVGAQSASGH
jgi:biopolymer transport protein TolQ